MQVNAVHLKLGPLPGVWSGKPSCSPTEVACEDTPLKGSRLVIEEVPVLIYCTSAGAERCSLRYSGSALPPAAHANIQRLRPGMRVFEVSAKTGEGVDELVRVLCSGSAESVKAVAERNR